ncbi:Mitochondrial genome maintenance protein [Tolypocladium paradoxum]|uniref:Mitochondrial genome maintenance protein MGM101 n=1 Tax=Tolypocladium paradoxum TaxID=94208 RepID=A0A2S4KPV3_9HYPO|nr:Mitochondrial genome maintenance protein [Tolypocladium paradoxum]
MGSQSSRPEPESPTMPQEESKVPPPTDTADDDEPDEWDKRIFSTGCADENAKMTDCYFEKKDWRACAAEMERFKQCWKRHGNDERTSSKDATVKSSPTQPPAASPVPASRDPTSQAMFLPPRAVAAAPRHLARRASSIVPLARQYATEAASPATPDAVEDGAQDPAPAAAAKAKPTPVASRWARTKSTRPASTPAASVKTASLPTEVVYQARTIAHRAQTAASFDAAGSPIVDWANSFHGISARPVSEEQFKVLMQPISEKDIEVKPDGVIYLPEIKYRRRLNEAFGPMGWGMIPKGEPVVGSTIVTREYALIVDGRFVSQAQGENSFFAPDQLPSAVEGCKSNALMRCCKDLGIGSELWDPHFVRWFKKTQMEEVWVEHATTKKKRTFWYRKGEVDVAYPYKLAR